MNWQIDFHRDSVKFMTNNRIMESFVVEKISLSLRRFRGEKINIDLKKLGGKWDGYFRIRVGKMRIIVDFKFDINVAYVEIIDWRGGAYN